MTFEVVRFEPSHAVRAAGWFASCVRSLRKEVPSLSASFADTDVVASQLAGMDGYAATAGDRLVGYLTSWYPIADFRGTDRVAAYSPAWAHGVTTDDTSNEVLAALYGAAATDWAAARCAVHALTLLASQTNEIDGWFRCGFGMGTIDAVRPLEPIAARSPRELRARQATAGDVAPLARLDAEHVQHYREPPVFMVPPGEMDETAWTGFLAQPITSAWIAEDAAGGPFAFLRIDRAFGGSDVVADEHGVFITGAYVRPSRRRAGAMSALLDAALRHYARLGARCMAVDFESFNPEASGFWLRHFDEVCRSVIRVPEFVGR